MRRRSFAIVSALLVAFAAGVADFVHVGSFGLLGDDWAILGDLVWNKGAAPQQTIYDIFIMQWEARPLRAVEYGLLYLAWRVAGIPGSFLAMWATIALSGIVLGRLVGRRLGPVMGLLAGLLFVLHPADTTHVWAATLMAKLGILYTLLACTLFARGRVGWAFALCVAALASYELSVFPFALAPFFADGGTRRSTGRALVVLIGALGLYGLWRAVVFSGFLLDTRVSTVKGGLDADSVLGLLAGLPAALPMILYAWPKQALEAVVGRESIAITLGAVAAFALVAGVVASRAPGARAGEDVNEPAAPWGVLLRAALWGCVGIVAGNALAFFAAPNLSIGVESRHNIAVIPGAVLVTVAAVGALARTLRGRAGAVVVVAIVALLLGGFASWRYRVQRDYVDAGTFQRRVLARSIRALGPLPPHTLVVLLHPAGDWKPERARAVRPFITGFAWESEAMFRLIYDESIIGLCLEDANDLLRAGGDRYRPLIEEHPYFHNVVFHDVASGETRWMRTRAPDPSEAPVPPSGPAAEFVLEGDA